MSVADQMPDVHGAPHSGGAPLRPLRIVIVTPRLGVGGTERHLLRILPELRRGGLDLSLFALERGGNLESEFATLGFRVEGPARRRPRFVHVAWASCRLYANLKLRRPDIVHFFLPESYLIGSFVAMAAGCRSRIMSRRSLANYQSRYPLIAQLERWLHGRTSVLLGNSTAVVQELIAECGVPAKVGLIHNGVGISPLATAEARRALRRSIGLPNDAFVLATVANLIPYKGHADLIEALGLAKDRMPSPDWRQLMIGRDEGIGAALRDQCRRVGIEQNVLWLSEQSEPERLIEAADVSVLPSHEEGFSNALLESMARGVPAIATAVGGSLDAIVHGESGLLVPARSPAMLADAILALAQKPDLRAHLARNACERAQQRFSLRACTRSYVALYRNFGKLPHSSAQDIIEMGRAPASVSPVGDGPQSTPNSSQ